MALNRLQTSADILREAITTNKATNDVIIRCGPDTRDIEAFGKNTAITWKSERASHRTERSGWAGSPSYEQAVEWLRYGWPEGTAQAAKLAAKLAVKLPHGLKVKTRYRPSVAPVGSTVVNVPAVVQGTPCGFIGNFKTHQRVEGHRILRVAVNVTTSSAIEPETIMNRGAAIMALMTTLERMRMTIDLTTFFCVRGNVPQYGGGGGGLFGQYYFDPDPKKMAEDRRKRAEWAKQYAGFKPTHALCLWNCKPAGMSTNPDQIAFALVNPSSQRRIAFAQLEHAPFTPSQFYHGYGYPVPLKRAYPDELKKFDIVLDSDAYDSGHWDSEETMLRWIKNQLKAQGINVDDASRLE
jgi:hypothetical protein